MTRFSLNFGAPCQNRTDVYGLRYHCSATELRGRTQKRFPMNALFIFAPIIVFFFPFFSRAAVEVTLDTPTLANGYTIFSKDQVFILGIPHHAVKGKKPVEIIVKKIQARGLLENSENFSESAVYTFQLSREEDKDIILRKALPIRMSVPEQDGKERKVYAWNEERVAWEPLPFSSSPRYIDTKLKQSSGKIMVVQEEKPYQTGIASWYDHYGAASNDYAMGSKIKVTNSTTGALVISTVVSSGPYIPGRIVDLPRGDFEKIAPLSSGVVQVKVEAYYD